MQRARTIVHGEDAIAVKGNSVHDGGLLLLLLRCVCRLPQLPLLLLRSARGCRGCLFWRRVLARQRARRALERPRPAAAGRGRRLRGCQAICQLRHCCSRSLHGST